MIRTSFILYLLFLPLIMWSCRSEPEEQGSIAETHPELEEQLTERSVKTPISGNENPTLYDRYRITMEEYESSGNYDVGNIYGGRLAPLDESSHADAKTYRSALQQGMKEGVNFAGKYTVITIGCGTRCQMHYVINRENGKMLDKLQSSTGARFSPDSRLFVVNPPDPSINYDECPDCAPEAYVFENSKFRKMNISQ